MMKLFLEMTAEEQSAYITERERYITNEQPKLGDIYTQEATKAFEAGLSLLEAFSNFHSFVSESRQYRDYDRRVNILITYIQKTETYIKKQISVSVSEVVTSRRGRPTKVQQALRRAKEEAQRESEIKASLFPEEKPLPNPKPLDNANVEGGSATETPSLSEEEALAGTFELATLSGVALHLDQLAFLLSKPLADAVRNGNIRQKRTAFAEASERAKALALQGKTQEAAEAAEDAHSLNAEIEGTYEAIDKELAAVYLRLKEDDNYIKEIQEKVNDIKAITAIVRPYHKKVSDADPSFDEKVRKQIKENSPEAVAKREAEKERHAKAAAIIKYLQRKDKPNTAKRIKGMETKLEELRTLIGEEADVYLPLIEYAKEHQVKK